MRLSKIAFRHLVEKAVTEIALALVKKVKLSEKEAFVMVARKDNGYGTAVFSDSLFQLFKEGL